MHALHDFQIVFNIQWQTSDRFGKGSQCCHAENKYWIHIPGPACSGLPGICSSFPVAMIQTERRG